MINLVKIRFTSLLLAGVLAASSTIPRVTKVYAETEGLLEQNDTGLDVTYHSEEDIKNYIKDHHVTLVKKKQ